MMGDSLRGWIEMLRIQATADKIKGNLFEVMSFARGTKPPFLTISS
jgi:hypothetical protein